MLPRFSTLILLVAVVFAPLKATSNVLPRQEDTSDSADAADSARPPPSSTNEYDYVIVGGGAAGSVLASRLTEDRKITVLLIEGGPDNTGKLEGVVPYIYQRTFMSDWDYNYTLTAQPGFNNRITPYFRGHVLGGSTSINGMTYTRGPAADWNKIADYLGDQSWNWNNMQPYFKKNEQFIPGVSPSNRYLASAHGTSGPIGVSESQINAWLYQPTLDAAQQSGVWAYNRDGNTGNPIGISWQQFAIKNGERSSAATGYLNQQVRARSNLKILVNSRVSRVLKASSPGPQPKFSQVEYKTGNGPVVLATAKKDIILSAGTIDTPTLLQRSGIGATADLTGAGITPVVNIPAVGKNFVDHVGIPAPWSVNSTLTDDEIDRNTTLFNELLAEWNQSRTGRLTTTNLGHIQWSRLPSNATIFQQYPDPQGGHADAPHWEALLANKWTSLTPRPATGNWVGMTHFVMSPMSRGDVKINPADPNGPPLINSGSLSHPFDIFVLRYAIRQTARFFTAPAWQAFNAQPAFDASILTSDAALDNFIRSNSFGGAHGVATAKIGKANSPAGTDVVGPNFRIKGIRGVRIVDASVIPFSPSGHSMVPVYVFAEKAADIIKANP